MKRNDFDVSISYYPKPRHNAKAGIVRIAFSVECTNRLGDFVAYYIRDNKIFFVPDKGGRVVSLKSSGTGEILYQKQSDVLRLKDVTGCYKLYFDSVKNLYFIDFKEKLWEGPNKLIPKRNANGILDDIGETLEAIGEELENTAGIVKVEPEEVPPFVEDLLVDIHGQLSNPVYALADYCESNNVSPMLDVIATALKNVLGDLEEKIIKYERI